MTDPVPVIVGIDPGTTTAVAIIDHTGEKIATKSSKEFSRSQITRYIIDHGKPVLIAVDVTPAPQSVEKIASAFGVELWEPTHDLSTDEKDRLASAYSLETRDDHVRDALAAARKSYHDFKDRIDEAMAKTVDESDEQGTMTAAIDTAINDPAALHNTPSEDPGTTESRDTSGNSDTNWKAVANRHIKRSKQKQETIERLRNYIEDLKDEQNSLREQLGKAKEQQRRDIKESEEYRRQKKKVQELEDELGTTKGTIATYKEQIEEHEQAVQNVVFGDHIMLPIISETSQVHPKSDTVIIKGSSIPSLPAHVTTTVVDDRHIQRLSENGYTVIRKEDMYGTRIGNVMIVDPETLTPVRSDSSFTDWLDDYRDRHDQET